ALLEPAIEIILRVRGLELSQLGVHVFIAGRQVELGRALLDDFVGDHAMQEIEAANICFFSRWLLRTIAEIGLVHTVQVSTRNLLAIDSSNHVRGRGAVASCHGDHEGKTKENRNGRTAERAIQRNDLQPRTPVGFLRTPALKDKST